MFGDVVVLNGLLEDLDGAEDTVGLRDSPLHKFIKLILKSGCGIGSDEEFVNFSTEFVGEIQSLHCSVDRVHLPLEVL